MHADIEHLAGYFYGFLTGYFESMPRWTTPFLKEVQSNLILYGYSGRLGDFFEEDYRSSKKYDAALAAWRTEIVEEPGSEEAEELEW